MCPLFQQAVPGRAKSRALYAALLGAMLLHNSVEIREALANGRLSIFPASGAGAASRRLMRPVVIRVFNTPCPPCRQLGLGSVHWERT